MASQNESDKESGTTKVKEEGSVNVGEVSGSTNLETEKQQPAPFSEFDPFRTARIGQINSEAAALLEPLQMQSVGLEGATEAELRKLYEDAEERATWNKARSDAFTGILRLGKRVPPRSKRIL